MINKKKIKIASASYNLDWFNSFKDYENKIIKWINEASDCDLLVFPEFASMELSSLGGNEITQNSELSLKEVSKYFNQQIELHSRLANKFNLYILMATYPHFDKNEKNKITNRAILIGPNGSIGFQDKQIMTKPERAWNIQSGNQGLKLFETSIGKIGILICYDSEFPLLARQLAQAEVEILLVPSFTECATGFNRVKISSMARALESQCVVVHSPTIGKVNWLKDFENSFGTAGIYAPADGFWSDDGIISQGKINNPSWVKAEINLDLINQSRNYGQVLTFKHWLESENKKLI